MKKTIIIGLYLLSLSAFAKNANNSTLIETRKESRTRVADVCSITEIIYHEGFKIEITATAATCEKAQKVLNDALEKAKYMLTSA
jgi:hypothetical protein